MADQLSTRIPGYRLHKPSGQAVVRLNGRDFYLGAHGTPDSKSKYQRLIAEYLAHGKLHPAAVRAPAAAGDARRDDLTINEIFVAYWKQHVVTYYIKDGEATSEQKNIKLAMRPLLELYGTTRGEDFGPVALTTCRQKMIDLGHARKRINKNVDRIRRMFKWAGETELASPMIYQRLRCVSGLRLGRSAAKETADVAPVPGAQVEEVLKIADPEIAAMIRLQLLTGMRPQEVTLMRTVDIDMSDDSVWWYRPARHKTQHHGRERRVPLGPKARALLRPWLRTSGDEFLFSPRRVMDRRNRERREARKSPMTPSQAARTRKTNPRKRPGVHYTTGSYARAIADLCVRADVTRWGPGRLRHNAATELRKRFDLDAARVVLGQNSLTVAEIYAETDWAKAAHVMKQAG